MIARSLAVLSTLAFGASASAAVVTFDTAASPVGTVYESPGTPPGSVAFTEDGIVMRTANFTSGGGAFVGYNFANIEAVGTNAFAINNIQFRADFTGLSFLVTEASFDWADFGGSENLGVNGVYVELGNLDLAPAVINGVNVVVNVTGPGNRGTVTFTSLAGINNIIFGGQEFAVDNVRAVPAPGALALLGLGGLLAARRKR